MDRKVWALFLAGALALTGCTIQSKHEEGAKDKNVKIETPMGNLAVRTDAVEAKDTGLSVFPGSTLKEDADDGDEKKANVNIDTPWFGVKVVALTYESPESQEKVWDYYKKEMGKYGRVLECRAGSPDLDLSGNDDELTCKEDRKQHVRISSRKGATLKVGTKQKQRIVAVKSSGTGTEYSLVYVYAREGKETL